MGTTGLRTNFARSEGLANPKESVRIMDPVLQQQSGFAIGRAELALMKCGAVDGWVIKEAFYARDLPQQAGLRVLRDPGHSRVNCDLQQAAVDRDDLVGIINFVLLAGAQLWLAEDELARPHSWPPCHREGCARRCSQ